MSCPPQRSAESRGAKLLHSKFRPLKGTRFWFIFRRSAFNGPLNRIPEVMPDMQSATTLLSSCRHTRPGRARPQRVERRVMPDG